MKPVTIIVLAAAVVAAGLALSDYFPRRADPETKLLKNAVHYAKEREAAAEHELKDRERELEHLHPMVVHDTAEVRRQKLAYDFAKTHLDTTSTDSLKAQLVRADSVIDSQARTIVDLSAERDAALAALEAAKKVAQAADYQAESLERLNAGVERELAQARRNQWKHDAKVVGATLAVRALVGLLKQ